MLDIFQFPFMQRALTAGLVLGLVLAYLGIFVVLRRMAFFSDGIAHASLAGIAIGLLVSVNPLAVALVLGVIIAVLMFWLEKKTNLSSDAIIGIFFTAGMALGVLLMSLQRGYQPELVSFLFGNILAIKTADLWFIVLLSVVALVFLFTQQKKLTLLSLDEDLAYVTGMRPAVYQLLLYVVLAVAVVLGIKMLGIVLVSALLIIPVSVAKLLTNSFRSLRVVTLVVSELIIVGGLLISFYLNLPTGAVIVLTGTAALFLALMVRGFFRKSITRQ